MYFINEKAQARRCVVASLHVDSKFLRVFLPPAGEAEIYILKTPFGLKIL